MAEQENIITSGGNKIAIRCLTKEDLTQAYDLTIKENWPVTQEDFHCMFKAQPQAFIGAFLEDGTLISKCFV